MSLPRQTEKGLKKARRDGVILTDREAEILELMRSNPMITRVELAERLSITRSSVATRISRLTESGHIRERGYVLDSEPCVVVVSGANRTLRAALTTGW